MGCVKMCPGHRGTWNRESLCPVLEPLANLLPTFSHSLLPVTSCHCPCVASVTWNPPKPSISHPFPLLPSVLLECSKMAKERRDKENITGVKGGGENKVAQFFALPFHFSSWRLVPSFLPGVVTGSLPSATPQFPLKIRQDEIHMNVVAS